MIRFSLLLGWLASASVLAADAPHPDGNWSRFRGPNGAGVNREATLPLEWKEQHFLWRTTLPGIGHSSPIVWGASVFVTSADGESGERFVSCVDAKTGQVDWTKTFSAASHTTHKLNSLASSTPAANSRHLFAAWGTPEQITVAALSHDGDVVWERDLGPYSAGHGFGQSVCLHGNLVVLPVEKGSDGFRIGLRQNNGHTVWKTPCDSNLHYATPCVRTVNGAAALIFVNWEQGIVGADPLTGETLWSADVFDKGHVESSIASPVLAGELVIGIAGWLGHGYEAVAVDPTRDGDKIVWKLDRGMPLCTTPVVVGDLVFFWSDNGIVTCADVADGSVHWRQRVGGNFYASPICAGDAVYNISAEGDVVVLAAKRRRELLARNPIGEASHATPAVIGDRMYVRTLTQLVCIGEVEATSAASESPGAFSR